MNETPLYRQTQPRGSNRPTLWIGATVLALIAATSTASPSGVDVAEHERIAASGRWIPDFLSLSQALTNSRSDQTLNTPALATLAMLADQLDWMLEQGGLDWCVGRATASSDVRAAWRSKLTRIS